MQAAYGQSTPHLKRQYFELKGNALVSDAWAELDLCSTNSHVAIFLVLRSSAIGGQCRAQPYQASLYIFIIVYSVLPPILLQRWYVIAVTWWSVKYRDIDKQAMAYYELYLGFNYQIWMLESYSETLVSGPFCGNPMKFLIWRGFLLNRTPDSPPKKSFYPFEPWLVIDGFGKCTSVGNRRLKLQKYIIIIWAVEVSQNL